MFQIHAQHERRHPDQPTPTILTPSVILASATTIPVLTGTMFVSARLFI